MLGYFNQTNLSKLLKSNLRTVLCVALFTLYFSVKSYAQDIFIFPTGSSLDKSVLINIDNETFNGIEATIVEFASLLSDEGYKVIIHPITESTPVELRDYIRELYTSESMLTGAIFVGEFPHAFTVAQFPFGRSAALSMEFYQDLDGNYSPTEWSLSQGEYFYMSHYGSVESEIWTSVIPSIGVPGSEESLSRIRNYFERNFAYRRKQKKEVRIRTPSAHAGPEE